jgi:isopenicillin-N N-acyltransferase-like protein
MKLLGRIVGIFLIVIISLMVILIVYVKWGLEPTVPDITDRSAERLQRTQIDSTFFKIKDCWLRKSNSGLWEEYIEGKPFDRGVIEGKLCKDLQYTQTGPFQFLLAFSRILHTYIQPQPGKKHTSGI